MSTIKNKKAAIVGIFILGGLGLLVTIILVMGGQRKSFAKTITVNALFDDVSGLQQGNNIWLAGVKVGTVKKIAFNPDSKINVSMSILSSMQPYIHKDAMAKISSESLIGNKIVVLTGGTAQAPLIQPGDFLGIKTSVNTEDMMNTLQENNKNLLAITTDFKNLSQRLSSGQGSIGKLLNDETLVNTMQKTLNTLNSAAANAREFTTDLSDYTAKLQTEGSLTNELITDTIVFNQLRNTVIQLQQVAQSAQAVVNNLNKASSGLSTTTSPIGVLLNDPDAAADLKSTLNNLNTGSQKLDENMEALQHNFLLRGFFRKKAKAKADSINKAAKL
jgi:phospholipid/cholesterol/gamma-HCH transport system substrate-binding protein